MGQQQTHALQQNRDLQRIVVVVSNLRQHLFGMMILEQLASDDVLDSAYEWLCRRRREYSAKVVNQTLGVLNLEKHSDKTFIGRIERGFDFLGYHFSPSGLTVAKKTITNFIEKASRLYEQERSAVSAASPLEMYVRRQLRWVEDGLQDDSHCSSRSTLRQACHPRYWPCSGWY